MSGINPIDLSSNNLLASYISASVNIMASTSAIGTRNTVNKTEAVKSSDTTEEIDKKDESSSTVSNAQTSYEKQIISNALDLASDLGLSVSNSTTIEELFSEISNRLAVLQESAGDNENIQNIINEYNNRFVYIYEGYINKQQTLSSQLVSSLKIMSSNAVASSGLV